MMETATRTESKSHHLSVQWAFRLCTLLDISLGYLFYWLITISTCGRLLPLVSEIRLRLSGFKSFVQCHTVLVSWASCSAPLPLPPNWSRDYKALTNPELSLNTCPFSGFKSSISILLFNTLCQIFMHTDISFKKIHFKHHFYPRGSIRSQKLFACFMDQETTQHCLLVSPPLRVPASLKSPSSQTSAN